MSGYGDDTAGLVDAAKRGDEKAFERLLDRFRNRMAFWVSTRMGPRLRARLTEDDVLKETYLRAHDSLPAFEDSGEGSFLRWLFSIAADRLEDLNRHHTAQGGDVARVAGTPADRAPSASPSAARAGRGELMRMLARALDRVPEAEREIVILRAVEKRSLAQIGELLGKSPATVGVLYVRGLEAMHRELGHGER